MGAEVDTSILSHNPQWLRLLHFKEGKSEVIDNDFFLSPEGKHDPKKELDALIKAYFKPFGKDPDSSPRCRFPARYLWLSRHISLPDFEKIPQACEKLKKWGLYAKADSVSLILVSGYMGNPASTFGHSYMKINTGEQNGLFDTSINYGAMIPKDESVAAYIFNGITGGYTAGYSDRYFYVQDMTYAHTEFRDMWDYRLNLGRDELEMLILHIWEIVGKKKRYYFFNRNCAYEIGRVAEVGIKDDLTSRSRLWFAPLELFNRLEELDCRSRSEYGKKLVSHVQYIPSSERRLVAEYEKLDKTSKNKARHIIKTGKIKNLHDIKLANFLLSYSEYRKIKEMPNPSNATRELERIALSTRISMPASAPAQVDIPAKPSPASGELPMIIAVGTGYNSTKDLYPSVSYTLYSQESTGQNSMDGDELKIFDASVGFKHGCFIDRIEWLSIRKFTVNALPDSGFKAASWNLQLRTNKDFRFGYLGKYDHSGLFGAGLSKRAGVGKVFVMADLSLHTLYPRYRIMPKIGAVIPFEIGKIRVEGGIENRLNASIWQTAFEIEYRGQIGKRRDVSLYYSNIDGLGKWYLKLGFRF